MPDGRIKAAAIIGAVILGCGGFIAAEAATGDQAVPCTQSSTYVLTCQLPTPVASTVTAPGPTTTVAGPTVTVTPSPTPTTSSATPTPSPTPTTTAPAPSGYPDATNTGVPAGTTLRTVPGQVTSGTCWNWNGTNVQVTCDTTISGLDINGALYANRHVLTITNTKIRGTGEGHAGFCLQNIGPNSTIQDSEIGGGPNGTTFEACIGANMYGPGVLLLRDNIHHVLQGLRNDAGTTVRDSWMHDFPMGDTTSTGSTDDHSEAAFTSGCHPAWGTCGAVILDHDSFSSGNTSNVFVQVDGSDSTAYIGTITIQNSRFFAYLHNGQNSTFGADLENKGITSNTHITITGNVFDKTGWGDGPVQTPLAATTASNNTYTDGTPIPIYPS